MEKTIITKYKKLFEKEIKPIIQSKDKLDSERNKIDSKRNEFYSEINKLDSKKEKLNSKINKLNSEKEKLDSKKEKLNSEINKLNSEKEKLDSEILMFLHKFEKKNDCVIEWKGYDFKFNETKFKYYNKDKTGFIFLDTNGKETEKLFEKREPKLEELSKEQLINKIKELQGN